MDDIHTFLIVVICIHCSTYLIDTIFKTCMLLPYFSFLHNTGLEIKPFRLHWYTTSFNRLIHKWGSTRPKLILAWFSTGSWITILLMPLGLILLVRSIYLIFVNLLFEEKSAFSNAGTLQPMFIPSLYVKWFNHRRLWPGGLKRSVYHPPHSLLMLVIQIVRIQGDLVPGINIPLSELGYYLVTLLICTVVHEVGHAIAAVREDGRVNGVGVVLLFCVPVAYVSLDSLELLPCVRQLRVLCAGVWHNVVLAGAALCTMLATPWLLLPLYDWGSGAQIQTVQQQSPVFGVGGLMERDLVVKVNECLVTDVNSWQNCLAQAARLSTPGHCLPSEFIKEHDESVPAKHLTAGVVECCTSNAPRHLCFEYLESDDEPLQLPQYSCLNARTVVDHSKNFCYKTSDCENNLHCFRPSLENNTKLVTIKTKSGRTVLFLGHPAEVYHTVGVSDYADIYPLFPSYIPDRIMLFCHYIVSFSIGMAFINIIPCFYFDGQHILRTLMDIFLTKHIEHSSVRHAMSLCLTFIGTFILVLYLLLAFWSAIQ